MSTIEVKGTKTDERPDSQARSRFEFKEGEKLSRLPLLLALAITGIVAYVESAFPSQGAVEAVQEEAGSDGETAGTAPKAERLGDFRQDAVAVVEEPGGDGSMASGISGVSIRSGATIFDFPTRPRVGEDSFAFRFDSPAPVAPAVSMAAGNDNGPLLPGRAPAVGISQVSIEGWSTEPEAAPEDGADDQGEGEEGNAGDIEDLPADEPDQDWQGGDTDDDNSEASDRNRAPVSLGTLRLNDVVAGQAVLIGLSQFLDNVSDPDGDALTIQSVSVSSGSIGRTEEGWVYSSNWQTPDQEVIISYEVSDGTITIAQVASFAISGRMSIAGTPADDILAGSPHSDEIDAGLGNDLIDGRSGDDHIVGDDGEDHILAGDGDDVVDAGAGNDVVYGGAENDLAWGGAGNDRLFGEGGDDILAGGGGDDLIEGGAGADYLTGGGGDDIIVGGSGADVIAGEAGDDRIDGGTGDDILHGGDGDDRIEDGAGDDAVFGDAGDDVVAVTPDGETDSFDGGTGSDVLDLSRTTQGVNVDIGNGTASSVEIGEDAISNFETVVTGSGDDVMTDGAGSQTLVAGDGDDKVIAALDAADDVFDGGDGNDLLDLSDTTQGVTVQLVEGHASGLEIGDDTIAKFEAVAGGSGDDCFIVDAMAATTAVILIGNEGDDEFHFNVTADVQASTTELIHQILDFMVGDQVYVADYTFRRTRDDSGEEKFERIYGDGEGLDDDEFFVRLRNERTDEIEYAVIDVDRDRDNTFEFAVEIYGPGMSAIIEHGTA